MEWIFLIAIGFICIACPILILLYLKWMPWYVSILFVVWIVACIVTIVFVKSKEKKWYERLIPSFIFTLIFTMVFLTAMDTNHYMFDENIGLWVVAPTLSLPAFYFVGGWLNGKWLLRQEQKRAEHNKALDEQISNKQIEIQGLERSIQGKTAIIHLLDMMAYCGEDVSKMENDPRVRSAAKITLDIEQKRNEMILLQKSKM